MKLLATAAQMQEFDRTAIGACAIPGLILMENAGRAFVEELERVFGPLMSRTVTVVCGTGNNGGDGLVIARHLVNRGCRVHVLLLGRKGELKGDAKTNYASVASLAKSEASGMTVAEVTTPRGFSRAAHPDIIVDAIFGTGFSGSAGGIQLRAIEWINQGKAYVAAVDVASGVDATTGVVGNVAVRAQLTVTMGLAKIGHFVGAGRDHTGELAIADISIPKFVFRPSHQQACLVDGDDVRNVLPRRPLTAHKYSVGKVFVLAGSRNFTGAPVMASGAVLRSGAGAVILGVPRGIHHPLVKKLTEVIIAPLEETPDGTVSLSAEETIKEKVAWADVVVIGPGLSRQRETDELLMRLIPAIQRPLLIDADGLSALASDVSVLRRRKYETILTPHVGELSRLTGDASTEIEVHRVTAARKAAFELRSIVVLKGSPTVTAVPGGAAYLNSSGNPGMATIGSGDVLTGTIAGLRAQGLKAEAAAYAGVFVHGRAGDIAREQFGERGMLAMDILESLPGALKEVEVR